MSEIHVAVDLRERLGPTRDQGARPTCLAFAASDTHTEARGDRTPLSCEYVFHHAQRRAGRSLDKGAFLSSMLEAVANDGQPIESEWPYQTTSPADAPPQTVGSLFARDHARISHEIDQVIQVLDDGHAAIVLLKLSSSFYMPDEREVIEPKANERPDPALRHAVIAIGHGVLGEQRVILVRNSWGSYWGDEGHAWTTESFLAPRLFGAAKLTGELHVPARILTA